jgi:hypothetical protein
MPNNPEENVPMDADEIAEMADAGEDVTQFFSGSGKMVYPTKVQRVNVDFALPMLQELDRQAAELNISRQAVIKSLLRQSLDQHYLALAHQPR